MQATEQTTLADKLDYTKACEYIERAASLGSRPGLARIGRLLDILHNPEKSLRFIHVAGTNGKGSTSAMISSALYEAGITVGMYYSPALNGIRDHYAVNGKLISEDDYAQAVSLVAAANEKLISETGDGATQFELETAVALTYFSENHCDVVVLECGMGGKDDATNIVGNKICCVITSVSFDHMQYLGDTLSKIASAKAGIITSDCPVIAYDSSDEVIDVIRKRCYETGSRLYPVDPAMISYEDAPGGETVSFEEFRRVTVGLAGAFQAENAALALRTLSVIRDNDLIAGTITDENIGRGLANVSWPFRFELINEEPPVYIDGAHNPDAAAKLRRSVLDRLRGYKLIFVIGVFADKDYDAIVRTFSDIAYMFITVQTPDNARALSANDLAACAIRYCENVVAFENIDEAYDRALFECRIADGPAAVIACGSLSYLGALREAAIESRKDGD